VFLKELKLIFSVFLPVWVIVACFASEKMHHLEFYIHMIGLPLHKP